MQICSSLWPLPVLALCAPFSDAFLDFCIYILYPVSSFIYFEEGQAGRSKHSTGSTYSNKYFQL